MELFNIPAFGEACAENRTNAKSRVFVLSDVGEESFDGYLKLLDNAEFIKKEEYTAGAHRFAAYSKDNDGVFLNYFAPVRELTIAAEDNCAYFDFADTPREHSLPAQITQIELEDFGMSYVIRLPDGRFIVIDGGRDFEPDRERLWNCLSEGSPEEKPVIAAWILTHPHSDHYLCFIGFMEQYGDRVTVERYILNFPEADDLVHYPKLDRKDKRFEDSSGLTNIPKMWEQIKRSGGIAYTAHTGQRFNIGGASLKILASMDDTIHLSTNINASSLVIRMELCGQVILWATDASFSDARLPEKFGDHLRADILQVPHHGFQCGTAEAMMRGYDLIRPKVCLLPVSEYNAYTAFSAHKESTRYLMTKIGEVGEFIVGTPQRTITLPYTAPSSARAEHDSLYCRGQLRSGANTWVFTELNTAREEDFVFTLMNMTHAAADVTIELYFESSKQMVRSIKATAAPLVIKKLNIVGDEVDGDHEYFDWLSLKKRGVPENVPFAVRFLSDVPIIISHPDHSAVYTARDN